MNKIDKMYKALWPKPSKKTKVPKTLPIKRTKNYIPIIEPAPMTPLDIEVLIWCHCRPLRHPRYDAPAVRSAIIKFWDRGMIMPFESYGLDVWTTTDKGCKFVSKLCHTKLPK